MTLTDDDRETLAEFVDRLMFDPDGRDFTVESDALEDAVEAIVAARLAQATEKALRDAADDWERVSRSVVFKASPSDWLRGRAARLAADQDAETPLLDALQDASDDLQAVPEWARPTALGSAAPTGDDRQLSEASTYIVKEVPTWHGQPDTPQPAPTAATNAAASVGGQPGTPEITSATDTPRTDRGSGVSGNRPDTPLAVSDPTHCANCGAEVPADQPHKVGECSDPTQPQP